MMSKKVQRQSDDVLKRLWSAGAHPKEFTRTASAQEVQTYSVPSLCNYVMRYIEDETRKSENVSRSLLKNSAYLLSGITSIYISQVESLYEETFLQALYVPFGEVSQSFTWKSSTPIKAPLKRKLSNKNKEPTESPSKRSKISGQQIDWQSLADIEIDREATMQLLRKSTVMKNDQISIRDVIEEPEQEMSEYVGFDAIENANTQNFLEIRKLVEQGRSILHIVENACSDFTSAGDYDQSDGEQRVEERYAPIMQRECDPLANVDGYSDEWEEDSFSDDGNFVMAPVSVDKPVIAARNGVSLPAASVPPSQKFASENIAARKRKRSKQICIISMDDEYFRKRASRAVIQNDDILKHLKLKLFIKPSRTFKKLASRYARDTVAMMTGIQRVIRLKRREANDKLMVVDFLESFGRRPQEEGDDNYEERVTYPQPCNERELRQSTSKRISEPFFEAPDEPSYDQEEDFAPLMETEHDVEMECEPNLASVNQSLMEPQRTSYSVPAIVPNIPKNLVHPKSEKIPRNVLRLLNQFITVQEEQTDCGSLKSAENKKTFGLLGVLERLFQLWHNQIYPVGMKNLMGHCKEKVAAALAFYSILELNSPRISLIEIEKCQNNAIYNIAMSKKLINLLHLNVN